MKAKSQRAFFIFWSVFFSLCLFCALPVQAKPVLLGDNALDHVTAGDSSGGAVVANASEATINESGNVILEGEVQSTARALNMVNSADSTVANGVNVQGIEDLTSSEMPEYMPGTLLESSQSNTIYQETRGAASFGTYAREDFDRNIEINRSESQTETSSMTNDLTVGISGTYDHMDTETAETSVTADSGPGAWGVGLVGEGSLDYDSSSSSQVGDASCSQTHEASESYDKSVAGDASLNSDAMTTSTWNNTEGTSSSETSSTGAAVAYDQTVAGDSSESSDFASSSTVNNTQAGDFNANYDSGASAALDVSDVGDTSQTGEDSTSAWNKSLTGNASENTSASAAGSWDSTQASDSSVTDASSASETWNNTESASGSYDQDSSMNHDWNTAQSGDELDSKIEGASASWNNTEASTSSESDTASSTLSWDNAEHEKSVAIEADGVGCAAGDASCTASQTSTEETSVTLDVDVNDVFSQEESEESSLEVTTKKEFRAPFSLEGVDAEYIVVDDSQLTVNSNYTMALSGSAQMDLRAMNVVNASGGSVANGVNVLHSGNMAGSQMVNLTQTNVINQYR